MEANGIAKGRTCVAAISPFFVAFTIAETVFLAGMFFWVVPARGEVLPTTHDLFLIREGGGSGTASRNCEVCHIPASDGKSEAGSSQLCLGCHDGTISTPVWGLSESRQGGMGAVVFGSGWRDHPVEVSYRPGGDFKVISNSKIRLYNGVIRCGTCHEIHGTDMGLGGQGAVTDAKVATFPLREENHYSGLCLDCHDK